MGNRQIGQWIMKENYNIFSDEISLSTGSDPLAHATQEDQLRMSTVISMAYAGAQTTRVRKRRWCDAGGQVRILDSVRQI